MKKIIVSENIVKSFGEGDKSCRVLDNVSVTIHEGEFVAIMGPSGSGKSTLLYAVSGMDSFEGGKVAFEGTDLSALTENQLADLRRTQMGFVFQQPTFLKNLNLLDNIILPSMRENRKKASEVVKQARAIMKKVGIEELEARDITQVSGGQLQRAGICRALMSHPKIIFGDEPTGALNSKAAEEIISLFSQINEEGTAIMLVTHDAKVAAKTERILFMKDGKIVSEKQLPPFKGTDLEERVEKIGAIMREIGI